MQPLIDETRLKALFKSALVEVLEEHPELLREAMTDSLEEVALVRAMEEAERGL